MVLLSPFWYFLFSLSASPSFEAQAIDSNISIGYGLAIGDVDGDQRQDILLADKKQFVWYRNGDWKRFILAENLTEYDNVCIAARDITGDGKVEIAVGAQWNPSETSDTTRSGAVFYLIRPSDPTLVWQSVRLHHEPTVHRMKWVKTGRDQFQLVVVPLHGRGNKNGEGAGVRVLSYSTRKTNDPNAIWKYALVDESMHMTHNFDLAEYGTGEMIYLGGKEGVKSFYFDGKKWSTGAWSIQGKSLGEVRLSKRAGEKILTGVEPMHGNELTAYSGTNFSDRTVLTDGLSQGHALAIGDLTFSGKDQIVIGWREPDADKKTGIKIYQQDEAGKWKDFWVDDNGIACEDLVLADLDADGKLDIIAAGRSSHNLKIYWNRTAGTR